MASRGSEEEGLSFFKLNNDESLTEGDSSTGESIGKVSIEPEEEFLPHLPFWLNLFGGLESLEELSAVANTIGNRN